MLPAPTTRAGQLVAEIERRIADDALAPGAFLGTRESLRQESGLAKATVNEALRLLAERGLVSVRPGRGGGLFVAEENPVVRLRHTLLAARDGAATIADVIEVRDALEPLVALVASRHCTEAHARTLREQAAKLHESARDGDDRTFLATNWALHESIAAIGSNEYLRAVYLGTMRPISDASAGLDDEVDAVAYLEERAAVHTELVEAIVSGGEERVRAAVAAHSRPPAGRA